MHNAAFAALGLDWVYVALPVARGQGGAAVQGAPALGLSGLNVTMPHKADAAAACDELDERAAALGAVNTIVVGPDGRRHGTSTDGPGLRAALADEGVVVGAGMACLVLGAGGAARAIALELGRAGTAVTVTARRPEAAAAAAALAGARALTFDDVVAEDFDVIVNATPVGMHGEAPLVAPDRLRPGQFVFDTVYPAETPLLEAARARGAGAAGGLGMLVHQGALAFEHFTGHAAPLDVMRAAARASGP